MNRACTDPICHNLPMCGRYRLSRRKQIIEEHFDSVSGEEDWSSRHPAMNGRRLAARN
jgi:hypothetical protein